MEEIIPISDLQTKAKKYVEQVKETDEAVVITQRGRPAAMFRIVYRIVSCRTVEVAYIRNCRRAPLN